MVVSGRKCLIFSDQMSHMDTVITEYYREQGHVLNFIVLMRLLILHTTKDLEVFSNSSPGIVLHFMLQPVSMFAK